MFGSGRLKRDFSDGLLKNINSVLQFANNYNMASLPSLASAR